MNALHLLLLEDSRMDAELIIKTLDNAGITFTVTIAANRDEFVDAINSEKFDAVLADNQLMGFNAARALGMIRERHLYIPFILVTGSISDELAVGIMHQGASDYILKDRLQRLPSALLSSIQKFALEKERDKYLNDIIANEAIMIEAARLANFGSWEVNYTDRTVRWSDEQYRILGYVPGEVEPTIDNLLRRIHPDDLDTAKNAVNMAFKYAKRQSFDARIIHRDGSIRYISGQMVSTCDETGRVLRINGFTQDVTHTREAELKERRITGDLVQRNKDLEQFAYIVSHNLRSPVANIVGLTNELNDDDMEATEQKAFISAIATSAKRLETVITDLNNILQASRHENENKQTVRFNDLVDEVKAGLGKQLAEKKVSIICDLGEMEEIKTLRSYMHSIFFNLISNSIKFRKPTEDPVIEIKSFVNKEARGLLFKDNGIGIDLTRNGNYLFGLYKRFHPDHAEGRGMGLYMVKSQVQTLGGKISVQSKVNEGTTFKIEFPN